MVTGQPLVLLRQDEIGPSGEVRTMFRVQSSGFPLYFASSKYTPSLGGHKTTLYSRQAEVGSVSLEYFQLGKSREIKASTFYTRPNFFSDKLVWRSFEGKQLRWKRDNSGALVLIDHKSRQVLASAQTSLSPAGVPTTTLRIHFSLFSAVSRPPNSRLVVPMSSPSSLSSTESSSSSSSKLKRASFTVTPPTLSYAQPQPEGTKGTTLELVILSLLHQDYQRLEKERQSQQEADQDENREWDPW
ncbi:uncharacterized protein JCM6883_003207 [Sporobolomyces salmoneus]|uniref:uncharacterized protein n=1 Tax=Sporobolomyces salmoneus TaxID=183962 RepID=UPI003177E180